MKKTATYPFKKRVTQAREASIRKYPLEGKRGTSSAEFIWLGQGEPYIDPDYELESVDDELDGLHQIQNDYPR